MYEDIGEEMNLTRERIRQIHNKALDRLKYRSRSEHLRSYLSLFYPDPELINFEGKSEIHYGINMGDEKFAVNLLRKHIKVRCRITPSPNIPNISDACRKLIIDILKKHGEPCSYNTIKELVYKKYPLLKDGAFDYALSTAENVINIHKGFYALQGWVIEKEKSEQLNKNNIKKDDKQKLSLIRSVTKAIAVNQKQYKIINFILENQGNVTKLKLTIFARLNHIDINQMVNGINKKFYEKFSEPLITEHESSFYLNNKFIS